MFSFTINHHPFVAIFHLNHYRIVRMELPTWVNNSLNFKGYTVTPGVAQNWQKQQEVWRFWSNMFKLHAPKQTGNWPKHKAGCDASLPCAFLLWEIHHQSNLPTESASFLCRHSPKETATPNAMPTSFIHRLRGLSLFGGYMMILVKVLRGNQVTEELRKKQCREGLVGFVWVGERGCHNTLKWIPTKQVPRSWLRSDRLTMLHC